MPTPQEFLATVIRPTLMAIDLDSTAAEQLLLGTAMQESDLVHRRQMGDGPARGFFQMEPRTHDDIWVNFLKFHPELAAKITKLLTSPGADKIEELEKNDQYACAMARAHYFRVKEALPVADDIDAIANYWKNHYNTLQGAGTAAQFIAKWKKAFPQ
jgi:hypothetical protein